MLALAAQCREVGDAALADTLLGAALDGIKDDKERQRMTLAAVDFLMETGQLAGADRFLKTLLEDEELAKRPRLWRLAQRLATDRQAGNLYDYGDSPVPEPITYDFRPDGVAAVVTRNSSTESRVSRRTPVKA